MTESNDVQLLLFKDFIEYTLEDAVAVLSSKSSGDAKLKFFLCIPLERKSFLIKIHVKSQKEETVCRGQNTVAASGRFQRTYRRDKR